MCHIGLKGAGADVALFFFFLPIFLSSQWQISISSFSFVSLPPAPSPPLPIGIPSVSMSLSICLSDDSASFLSSLSFSCLGTVGDLRRSHTHTHTELSFIDVAGVGASGQCQSERCLGHVIVINVGLKLVTCRETTWQRTHTYKQMERDV